MVLVLLVDEVLVKSRIAESHQVVQTTGGLHYGGHCFTWLLRGGQQALEAVGQDAKCILYNATCTRQTVVEDAFFISEVSFGKWLLRAKASSPTMKYGMFLSSLGRGSGAGSPKVPSCSASFNSHSLKIWVSDTLLCVPTLTQMNL